MGNNFEIVQCTSLNKLVSLDPLYFKNGQVAIIDRMLFFRNRGKGKAEGCHCDNLSFLLMLVCLFVSSGFWGFCFSLFVCLFSFPSVFKGTASVGMKYHITLLVCICVCLFM